jgi:cell division protein FtsL
MVQIHTHTPFLQRHTQSNGPIINKDFATFSSKLPLCLLIHSQATTTTVNNKQHQTQ